MKSRGKKLEKSEKFFEKSLDFSKQRWYIVQALARVLTIEEMREWRNRQTCTFEGRVG